MELIGQEASFGLVEKAKNLPEFAWDWHQVTVGGRWSEVRNCMWFLELLTVSLWELEWKFCAFCPFANIWLAEMHWFP